MEWNRHELNEGAELASAIASWSGARCARLEEPRLTLRLSDAAALREGLPPPLSPRALLIRHLLRTMRFDETRIFRWRLDHKLVQALAIEQWCPGVFPISRGLGRELAGMSREEARAWLSSLDPNTAIVKAALGEASGETDRANQSLAALEALADEGAGQSCPKAASEERFMVQERLQIDSEYRVHSLEDQVIPDLTFRRYAPEETRLAEREAPTEFVRSILSRLPDGLVKDTLYGWDVALDRHGRWRVIELNPSGYHPVFKRGFHCSGFFQTPAWGPPATARLLRFVSERYGIPVEIALDADGPPEEHAAYWWALHCKTVLDEAHASTSGSGANARREGLVPERMETRLSASQNLFAWALTELRAAQRPANVSTNPMSSLEQPASSVADAQPGGGEQQTGASITPADRERVREWNRTAQWYPSREYVHTLFEAQVRERPDAPAVADDGGELTYAELNRRANQLARYLRAHGVDRETCVGICMRRSTSMVVALLAVMKAGGAYTPLPVHMPRERLSQMVENARVTIALTDHSTPARLSHGEVTTIDVDYMTPRLARECADDLESPLDAENLAYVIHTSGSTGRPKAVGVRHAGLTNLLCEMKDALNVGANDRWLAVTPLSFDIAALELYLPLIAGGQVWIAGEADFTDAAVLMHRLDRSASTILQATPMTWELLIEAGWTGGPEFRALVGGEALPAPLAKKLSERVAVAWNLYGPTETTVWSSRWIVDGQRDVSIGRPIANTELYVLNREMELQPPGVPGELYIGGAGLARAYLNQPGLTAERFIPDPHARHPGARLYRTGDWARWIDGTLEALGRTDDQVKVRGVRIECGEIETVLREHADVREAAVVARNDARRQIRLVAFVVYARDGSATHDELKSLLRARLPEYMVPAVFVTLQQLPRTPHGKVDRKSLVWVDEPRPSSATASAAPRTGTEERLAGIWSAILRLETIGLDDDFLELGGQSLSAAQCILRVRETFGVELPLVALFDEPASVRRVAAMIDECLHAAERPLHSL